LSPSSSPQLVRDPRLHAIFGVTLMAVLGASSVTPAFPVMIRELDVGAERVGLVLTVFTLPGVVFSPFLGFLADRVGRKPILVPSLLLFALAGGACTLARDFHTLLALRFLQGTGAAVIGSLNVTLIGDLFEGRSRPAAMGLNSAVLSAGTATYPAVGGMLAGIAWHWPFALPLLALPVAALVVRNIPPRRPEGTASLSEYARGLAGSLRSRAAIVLFATSLVTFVLLYGAFLAYLPIHMAGRLGASPLVIGIVLTTASVATGIVSSQLGRLEPRVGGKRLIVTGFALYVVALGLVPLAGTTWQLAGLALLFGVAQAINIPTFLTMLTGLAPARHRAAFMAVNGTVLRLGQTLGPLIMGLVVARSGTSSVFVVAATIALVMGGVIAVLLPGTPGGAGHRNGSGTAQGART
jgi:MFS family permease